MIHSILFVQFTCLTVLFHNLCPSPLWFSSWSWALYFILHAFLHPIIIFFSQHMPISGNWNYYRPTVTHTIIWTVLFFSEFDETLSILVLFSVDFDLQLHIFVQLQQDVEAKYPEFVTAVVSKIMPSMTQPADEDDCCQRLFTNFIHLCQWSNGPDTQQSARYTSCTSLYVTSWVITSVKQVSKWVSKTFTKCYNYLTVNKSVVRFAKYLTIILRLQ